MKKLIVKIFIIFIVIGGFNLMVVSYSIDVIWNKVNQKENINEALNPMLIVNNNIYLFSKIKYTNNTNEFFITKYDIENGDENKIFSTIMKTSTIASGLIEIDQKIIFMLDENIYCFDLCENKIIWKSVEKDYLMLDYEGLHKFKKYLYLCLTKKSKRIIRFYDYLTGNIIKEYEMKDREYLFLEKDNLIIYNPTTNYIVIFDELLDVIKKEVDFDFNYIENTNKNNIILIKNKEENKFIICFDWIRNKIIWEKSISGIIKDSELYDNYLIIFLNDINNYNEEIKFKYRFINDNNYNNKIVKINLLNGEYEKENEVNFYSTGKILIINKNTILIITNFGFMFFYKLDDLSYLTSINLSSFNMCNTNILSNRIISEDNYILIYCGFNIICLKMND